MFSLLVSLITVFALLVGLMVLLRRFGVTGARGRYLKVVESVSIGSGKSLSLVKVGERYFLLAAAADRVSLIGEMTELPAPTPAEPVLSQRLSKMQLTVDEPTRAFSKAP